LFLDTAKNSVYDEARYLRRPRLVSLVFEINDYLIIERYMSLRLHQTIELKVMSGNAIREIDIVIKTNHSPNFDSLLLLYMALYQSITS
jgi:hypothetical protein